MSVKLIGKIINNECYQLIDLGSSMYGGHIYEVRKITKPLFPGDRGTNTLMHIGNCEETARFEFNLICEGARL